MSYQKSMAEFNYMISAKNFDEAHKWIGKKKVMKKSRNEVLLNMELASIERMNGNLEASNSLLHKADYLIEDRKVNIAQRAMSLINNPLSLPYQTEFFEDIAVNYYKCLNFLEQRDFAKARVEARRANLSLNRLNDAVPDKPLKYHDDVLAHTIMGLAYELNNEVNQAFVAYRNAVDLFIHNGKKVNYMGTKLPKQLVEDLFRTGSILKFGSELSYYSRVLGYQYKSSQNDGGELIVFWENGRSPQKQQLTIAFNLEMENGGGLSIVNEGEGIYTSLSPDEVNNYNYDITADHVSIALPIYKQRYYPLSKASVRLNGVNRDFELLENLNVIAPQSLKDRYFRELGNAILRVLTKRAIQESLSQIDISDLTNDRKEDDKKEEEETEEKDLQEDNGSNGSDKDPISSPDSDSDSDSDDDNRGDIDLGQVFNVVSTLTERADIRSWQSLPAQISYARIPLKKGKNVLEFSFFNSKNKRVTATRMEINGDGRSHVRNIITPYNAVVNPM